MGSIIRINRRLSNKLQGWSPHARMGGEAGSFISAVRQYVNGRGRVVVDTGGGKRCFFAGVVPPDTRIIAIDFSQAELSLDKDVQGTVVADVTAHIPLEGGRCGAVGGWARRASQP